MSLLVGAASNGPSGYSIDDSLRFRSSASAYLQRTPAGDGNRRTWTWSCWVKRGSLATSGITLFGTQNDSANSDYDVLYFDGNKCRLLLNGGTGQLNTTQVFRDPSAWYHIILAIDTTQATDTNRMKMYINGAQVTAFDTATYVSVNHDTWVNKGGRVATIGAAYQSSASNYLDGYLAEINFVDGQQLTPTSFGETDNNGTWIPKKYTGTYGTNGFYLGMKETVPVYAADYLVVAGGGGGGCDNINGTQGGGGGAGGLLTGSQNLATGNVYTITVGAGGAGAGGTARGTSGSNSVFDSYTAIGGGGGGGRSTPAGLTGGSGGGGVNGSGGGANTVGQGFDGATGSSNGGGGGGGAGANASGNTGGVGVQSSITGTAIYYAGGGGGRNGSPPYAHGSAGSGSIGQGGGMGGGGGAAAGATGVVILRMLTSKYSGTTTGSPSVATDGSHTVLTYNSSGTYTG